VEALFERAAKVKRAESYQFGEVHRRYTRRQMSLNMRGYFADLPRSESPRTIPRAAHLV
jgi:hypothetical protein